jgi:hypothetical protein
MRSIGSPKAAMTPPSSIGEQHHVATRTVIMAVHNPAKLAPVVGTFLREPGERP